MASNPLDMETVDYIAITRVQARYADVVNRRAWSELGELFAPDAMVRVDTVTNPVRELVGPEALGSFIGAAIERFDFFEFVILNTVVDVGVGGDPDAASGRVFMCELRRDAESGRFTTAFGVYLDSYRRVDGRWRFAHRNYQSLARSGRAEVFAFPHHLVDVDGKGNAAKESL